MHRPINKGLISTSEVEESQAAKGFALSGTELTILKDEKFEGEGLRGAIGITKIIVEEGATIDSRPLCSLISLTELNISKDVTIGNGAFKGCVGISELNIPKGARIGRHAFQGCTAITKLNIADNVTIEYGAFWGCTGITELNIPNNMTINGRAFQDCTKLKRVVINGSIRVFGIDGVFQDTAPDLKLFVRRSEDVNECKNMQNLVEELETPTSLYEFVFLRARHNYMPEDMSIKQRGILKLLLLIDQRLGDCPTRGLSDLPADLWCKIMNFYMNFNYCIRRVSKPLTCEDLDSDQININLQNMQEDVPRWINGIDVFRGL